MSTNNQRSAEKPPPISRAYWYCQLVGWSALLSFQMFALVALEPQGAPSGPRLHLSLVLLAASGFVLSHLFYLQMRRLHWLQTPLRRVWPRLFASISIAAALQTTINLTISILWVHAIPAREHLRPAAVFVSWLVYLFLFAIWTTIYLAVHEFRSRRIAEVNALRMELVAQEAQLRGLRAQLNPHFLFNCLNSLRELIVENPRRAQTMVTQLSGLLRYSLQSDHTEQVLLEDEIDAVKDYLALEGIRFEERLHVRWNIAPEAGSVPVPPMLLQTLVENALKHGIARRPEGGEVSIQALVHGRQLELEVVNSGELSEQPSEEGIGLRNARARLQLLYGDQANIVLESVDHGQVRAIGTIPVKPSKAAQ